MQRNKRKYKTIGKSRGNLRKGKREDNEDVEKKAKDGRR
jgi:hypothetical protein